MKKYIRVDIVDNDYDYGDSKIMDTYILINPDMTKLEELQKLLDERIGFGNRFTDDFGEVHNYITKHFDVLELSDFVELEW